MFRFRDVRSFAQRFPSHSGALRSVQYLSRTLADAEQRRRNAPVLEPSHSFQRKKFRTRRFPDVRPFAQRLPVRSGASRIVPYLFRTLADAGY